MEGISLKSLTRKSPPVCSPTPKHKRKVSHTEESIPADKHMEHLEITPLWVPVEGLANLWSDGQGGGPTRPRITRQFAPTPALLLMPIAGGQALHTLTHITATGRTSDPPPPSPWPLSVLSHTAVAVFRGHQWRRWVYHMVAAILTCCYGAILYYAAYLLAAGVVLVPAADIGSAQWRVNNNAGRR